MSDPDPKAALRTAAKERRHDAFHRFGTRIGPILAANFLARFSLGPGDSVAGYWPTGEEADIRTLLVALADRGHAVGLPRVVRREEPLVFHAWKPGDAMVEGHWGILEPPVSGPAIRPRVVIVPLLAFDWRGHRLGYGAGYYDRTLAAYRAEGEVVAVGAAFEAQMVDRLPAAAHDEPLDWILTERECRRLGNAPGRESRQA